MWPLDSPVISLSLWWQCVEGSVMVSSEKDHILGMLWLWLKSLREVMVGTCFLLPFGYKILNGKFNNRKLTFLFSYILWVRFAFVVSSKKSVTTFETVLGSQYPRVAWWNEGISWLEILLVLARWFELLAKARESIFFFKTVS